MLVRLAFPQVFFSLCMSESDRMWNAADRVEDSPRSGEEQGGWIPSLGYSGKEGVTFLFARIMGWQPGRRSEWGLGRAGSSGVIHSYHHIHSCRGRAEWEDEGREKKKKTPMMYAPQACWTSALQLNGDNEVDPVEYR